ncbi:MAG: fructosamine kinase family protein, partial [Myxococcales bacterium]|nr:fructosamine kinase family protein [Myxococcales bacterium]
ADVLRVPEVVAVAREFIVLEHIETSSIRPPGFSRAFGAALAELHTSTSAARFGFAHDNYLGATPQPNGELDDWVEFFGRRRIGYQLGLARERGHARRGDELDTLGARLLEALGEIIGEPDEPPCLLHGDLWGGNYLVAEDGAPVLIDPAVYYGRREADLAMTRLFGGFDGAFYAGYEARWPLAAGAERRFVVYELYHLLNHLNLFGGSYRSSCIAHLRRLV